MYTDMIDARDEEQSHSNCTQTERERERDVYIYILIDKYIKSFTPFESCEERYQRGDGGSKKPHVSGQPSVA